MSLQQLSRAFEHRTLWTHSFIMSPGIGTNSTAHNTHTHLRHKLLCMYLVVPVGKCCSQSGGRGENYDYLCIRKDERKLDLNGLTTKRISIVT